MSRPQKNGELGKFRVAGIISCGIFALIAPCVASAQEAQPEQLGEVIVTAERRPENLQSAATTVTAVTATELTNAGVIDTMTLPTLVPADV